MTRTRFLTITESGFGLILKNLWEQSQDSILLILRDNNRLYKIQEELKFFLPETKSLLLPGWDTMPYDRVSPSSDIVAKRIETLANLQNFSSKRAIVIATVSSIIQYLPPRNKFQNLLIKVKKGDHYNREKLIENLVSLGFIRSVTARDSGEFAVRGSILDIMVPGEKYGWRLDFFGDEVDKIRVYNPETQISNEDLTHIRLMPTHEVIFTEENVELFKANFRKYFGPNIVTEILYKTISEKRYFPGFEHWLPLFYPHMETIFDYLQSPLIVMDHLAENAINEKYVQIHDYYHARYEDLKKNPDNTHYFPIKPELFWLPQDELKQNIDQLNIIKFSSLESSDSNKSNIEYSYLPNVNEIYQDKQLDEVEKLSRYLNDRSLIKLNAITCNSFGSRERIREKFKKSNLKVVSIDHFSEMQHLRNNEIGLINLPIDKGFETEKYRFFTEAELFHFKPLKINRKLDLDQLFKKASSLVEGEIVVHKEHGIGKFLGLNTLKIEEILHDFLTLEYEGGDKLYVPVENIELISRYGNEEIPLDRLGGAQWKIRKTKLKKKIFEIATELLNVAAKRQTEAVSPIIPIKELYEEFCNRFPYEETEDQLESISQIEQDLAQTKPMDRLLCGDVGFGKTEVAMRAAFITVNSELDSSGIRKQVAIIVPTTLLAKQHYDNFRQRFTGMNVNIGHLSRFISATESAKIKKYISQGDIDIIIGTHALLSNNITFKNLSLMIIDEEQHFGVIQKEKLKKIKPNIHILTLSATPIPRTLQMSLSGIKELSLLANPPQDRLPVKTYVLPFDSVVIREAILREHYRGGKTFYVSPRIEDLEKLELKIRQLVPEIKMVTAHAQMPTKDLDKIINGFYEGMYDLLLATTIVESGLDIPSANTIIIHRSDMLGLSKLYQLRGRVGRGKIRGYAYLTIPNEKLGNKKALQRLEVIQNIEELGVGFTVATRDMELRGYGNLLGDQQSGHIKEVGVELYQEMLNEAISNLNNRDENNEILEVNEDWSPSINLGISVLIPQEYIADIQLRVNLYKRLASFKTNDEIENFAIELIDRFGKFGQEVSDLLEITKIKMLCKKALIEKIDVSDQYVIVKFRNNKFLYPEELLKYIFDNPLKAKLNPDQRVMFRIVSNKNQKLETVKQVIQNLLLLRNNL